MKNVEKKETEKKTTTKKVVTKSATKPTATKKVATKSATKPTTAKKQATKKAEVKTEKTKSNAKKVEAKTYAKKTTVKKVEPKKTEIPTKKTVETKKAQQVKKAEAKKEQPKEEKIVRSSKDLKDDSMISSSELKKLGIFVLIIAGVFVVFYVGTKLFKKDDHSDIFKESLDTAEIQYTDILISKLLKQNQTEYYVLIEDSEDEDLTTLDGYAQTYQKSSDSDGAYKMYTAQLRNALNKKHFGETDSYETDNLIFSKTTLVKVSNGSISETYTGKTDISNKLEGLIGEISE